MITEITDEMNAIPTVRPATEPNGGPRSAWQLGNLGNWLAVAPAAVLPLLVFPLGHELPDWVWMWTLALSLFIGVKWITLFRLLTIPPPSQQDCGTSSLSPFGGEMIGVRSRGLGRPSRCIRESERRLSTKAAIGARLFIYTFFWPGLDAAAFCGKGIVSIPGIREWKYAVVKTAFGAALLWAGVRLIGATHALVIGWVGMLGMVFLLHFGVFHLLSLFWRAVGIDANPIMQLPGMATSLGKFWGGRWNVAFSDLMREDFFKPLARQLGARRALFAVFLISGISHELVISVPARGGYGLPTLYFLTQGLGLLFERSEFGRRIGLGSGRKGWCFVALVAGLPAFWLFPPIFVHHVILPMLRTIGAT